MDFASEWTGVWKSVETTVRWLSCFGSSFLEAGSLRSRVSGARAGVHGN